MIAVLTPGLDAHAEALSAIQRINQKRSDRALKVLEIRRAIKSFAAGLQADELLDLVCSLREGTATHLVGARERLLELACDLDGVVHYGSHA